MATTFKFFTDPSLVTEFDPATDRIGPVTDPPQDFLLYLGSPNAARRARANSDPGIDNIVVSITDTDPGNNLEDTDVKIAGSNADLDTVTGGADYDLGVQQILGGTGGKEEIHIRVSYSGSITSDETVGIAVNTLTEDEP